VAVILNSLNGEFIDRSFAVLANQGRFVEIGKIGIWTSEQAQRARPDGVYFPFDIAEVDFQDPTLHPRLWRALVAEFTAERLKPLPHTLFPADEIVDAFRFMQQAKQIGKIVISFQASAPATLRHDASYLITGGLGALGLQVAEQLVEDGARYLILSSRRGLATDATGVPAIQERLRALQAKGAVVHIVPADSSERAAVARLLSQCQAVAPLRGIVHAAGVLDDGVLLQQSAARLATVMQPKVQGAWHLHCLTQGLPLDFFVCFSSVAALLGSAGQGNYAAANAFMDTLMQMRHQQGLPGLSINWGPWAESGMAAALQARMQSQGMGLITAAQGRALFQSLFGQSIAQVAVIPAQMALLATKRAHGQVPVATSAVHGIRQQLEASGGEQRFTLLTDYLRSEIASVLGLNSGVQIDMRSRLFEFGLDSLMAVELKNKLQAGLGCSLRSTLLFDYPTLEALIPYLLYEVLQLVDEAPGAATSAQPEEMALAEVEAFSSAELLAFIDQRFEDIA
jgi:myxalamid-type polyketide synthase MxaB